MVVGIRLKINLHKHLGAVRVQRLAVGASTRGRFDWFGMPLDAFRGMRIVIAPSDTSGHRGFGRTGPRRMADSIPVRAVKLREEEPWRPWHDRAADRPPSPTDGHRV